MGRHQLCQAEVEDLDAAVPGDEDVLGLQVPVDDALLVGRGEPGGDLRGVFHGSPRREGSARELGAQRLAFEQLLDDVGRAFVLTDVVDRRDVRVVENAGGFRFLLEAAKAIRVLREGCRQHLDRDLAPEPRIPRPIDLAHTPRADRAEDLVGAELGSARERHFSNPPMR